MRDRLRSRRLAPALWLVADAAVVGIVPGLAEALMLFALTPDRPLTLGGYLAALVGLAPQVVGAYVLLGPALVLAGRALAVGRFTRTGLSLRYMLRFALLDAVLLGVAAAHQYRALGSLLPPEGRLALAVIASSLSVAALVLALLVGLDQRREGRVTAPWLVAVGVGLVIAVGVAASLRRVRIPDPVPLDLPGFAASRRLLLVELPGLTPDELRRLGASGELRAISTLAESGTLAPVRVRPPFDPLALHASLVTGKPAREHGIFGAVRFRPLWDRRSFAVLPRGLFLAPLLGTRLWVEVPVDHRALRAVALPGIARALGLRAAVLGDPLGWPDRWCVPARALRPGAEIDVPGAGRPAACPDPGDMAARYFQPAASRLPAAGAFARRLRIAAAADACALDLAARALDEEIDIVHARLGGHEAVALQFAGYRERSRARAVSDPEVAAYRYVLRRYRHDLDERLAPLVERALAEGRLVALVSTHAIRARQGTSRLLERLVGVERSTAEIDGTAPGALLIAGEGVAGPGVTGPELPLEGVLPTLLWAVDLPVAEDAGPIAYDLFGDRFREAHPVVTVPSYNARRRSGR